MTWIDPDKTLPIVGTMNNSDAGPKPLFRDSVTIFSSVACFFVLVFFPSPLFFRTPNHFQLLVPGSSAAGFTLDHKGQMIFFLFFFFYLILLTLSLEGALYHTSTEQVLEHNEQS